MKSAKRTPRPRGAGAPGKAGPPPGPKRSAPASRTQKGTRWALILTASLAAFSLVQGVLACLGSPDRGVAYSVYYRDHAVYYDSYAKYLVGGQLFNDGLSYFPPLPAFLLSLLYRLGLDTVLTAKAAYVVLGAVVTALIFTLGRSLFSLGTAFWGAMLWAASFGGLALMSGVNAELPFLLLLLTALIAGRQLRRSPYPYVNGLCVGVLCGLMALTRAEGLWIAVPFGLYVLFAFPGGRKKGALGAALLVVVAFVTVAPWSMRCYRVMSVFKDIGPGSTLDWSPPLGPVTVTNPLMFALANHVLSDGGYAYGLVKGGLAGGTSYLSDYTVRTLMVHGYREGWFFIRQHPRRFLTELVPHKLARAAKGLSMGLLPSNLPAGVAGTRPSHDFFIPDDILPAYVLAALFCAGLIVSLVRGNRPVLLILVFAYYVLWTALFAGEVATGVMLAPLVYLVSIEAVSRAVSRVPSRRTAPIMRIVTAAVFVAFLGAAVLLYNTESLLRLQGEKDPVTGKILQDKPVRITLEPAP